MQIELKKKGIFHFCRSLQFFAVLLRVMVACSDFVEVQGL